MARRQLGMGIFVSSHFSLSFFFPCGKGQAFSEDHVKRRRKKLPYTPPPLPRSPESDRENRPFKEGGMAGIKGTSRFPPLLGGWGLSSGSRRFPPSPHSDHRCGNRISSPRDPKISYLFPILSPATQALFVKNFSVDASFLFCCC